VLAPVVVTDVEPPPEPEPEPAPEPARRTSNRQPRRAEPARPESPATTPEPATPDPTPAPNAPLLRKPQTADEGEQVRTIRETLDRASRDLGRVNYQALKAEGRSNYDTAKRFIDQAEVALRDRNFVFASYLAGKAETLARELYGQR